MPTELRRQEHKELRPSTAAPEIAACWQKTCSLLHLNPPYDCTIHGQICDAGALMVMAWVASLQAFGTRSSPGHERPSSPRVMPQCWCQDRRKRLRDLVGLAKHRWTIERL